MKKLLVSVLSLALVATTLSPFTSAKAATNEPEIPIVFGKTLVFPTNLTPNPLTSPIVGGGVVTNSIPDPETGSSTWAFWETDYYTNKMTYSTISSASAAMGVLLGIPVLSVAGIVGNWMITNTGNWIYIRDVKYWRMSGGVLQVQHNISYFANSSMTTKVGGTAVYITNY
jgi:hypothetical protein